MRYRQVGRSGLVVSELSLGTWSGGLPAAIEQLGPCVGAALDAGVTTFHSSPDWLGGATESVLGAALTGEDRDRLVLCSGIYPGPPTDPGSVHPKAADPNSRLSRKRVFAGVRGALRRLRTDHIDVLSLMRYDEHTPLEETIGAVADLVRQGSVHYLATSEWTADQITEGRAVATAAGVELVANQPLYSMLWRVPEAQVMRVGERTGIGQMAFAPLGQGLLSGKYCDGAVPPGSRAADPCAVGMGVLIIEELLDRVDRVAAVAEDIGMTAAQLAIAWVLQNHQVCTAVVGASDPTQVAENAQATGRELPFDVLLQIDQLLGRVIQSDPRMSIPAPI